MIKKIGFLLMQSCTLFTSFVFLLYIAGYIVISDTITLSLKSAALLFCACVFLCLVQKILYIKRIPFALRITIHFLLILSAVFLIFMFIGKIVTTSLQSFILLTVLTVLYVLIALAFMLISGKRKDKINEKNEYSSIFKK